MTLTIQTRAAVLVASAAALLATFAWTAAAFAQRDFPTRPVRMVNPYTPGGSVDLVGRAVATGLSEVWGSGHRRQPTGRRHPDWQ